ncbi:MAG: alpha/beta fold hydrolase [Bacteroidota bacterium]
MKIERTTLVVALFLMSLTTFGQDITGKWNGLLEEMGLRLSLNISKTDTGYSSTLDSPDQGAFGIPVTTTSFKDSLLKITVTNLGITYSGEFGDNVFKGTFTQGGFKIPLELSRENVEKVAANRPQEPKEPYPYRTEEVKFENVEANVTLAGTLTLPKNGESFPAVILISGSGPQNRDEELLGHKPFLVISDYLTRQGIAVLRFDDRGFGASTGDFEKATSEDFSTDVESALSFLKARKEINNAKIGLAGHSVGGIIAPMVASRSKDVDFIVLLAGTGIRGDQLLMLQGELIESAMGKSEEEIKKSSGIRKRELEIALNSEDPQTLKRDIKEYLNTAITDNGDSIVPEGMSVEQFIATQVNQISTPWMMYFIKYNPVSVLEKVSCPVLAVNGEKDLQVPPKENLTAIENALKKGGNTDVTVMEFPGLNHLFQECETGSPTEYGEIEQTFSPLALEAISDWILNQVK